MRVLKGFSDKIEIYSIDEAFIDLSHIKDEMTKEYGKKSEKEFLSGLEFQQALVFLVQKL